MSWHLSRNAALAYFAGGCFWGVELFFRQHKGVLSVVSGYMGGYVHNPSYRQVCTGTTGHAETVRVEYDPFEVCFEELARYFFEIHDPTQIDRQGPDIGPQYRSAIFYVDQGQRKTARQLVRELHENGFFAVTQIVPAAEFFTAEDYHQGYLLKHHGHGGGCHMRVPRFREGAW